MNNASDDVRDLERIEQLKRIQPEKTRELNDIGFSQLFAELYKDELVYNVTAKCWYRYDGTRWIADVGSSYAAQQARSMYFVLNNYGRTVDGNQADVWLKAVGKYQDLRKRETLIRDAQSLMRRTASDFDCNRNLLNCQNCTIDLTTGQPHDHTPNDYLTKVAGCDFSTSADGSRWLNFLDEIMQGNQDKIAYLQRMAGYFLTAETYLETAFFLYGETTRNGKTTFVETLAAMLGDYASTVTAETLALTKNRGSETANPQIAGLAGCRFVRISELPKRMMLDVALFKHLTGGDMISARQLYQNPFQFVPEFKLCLNCNELPVVTDDTVFASDRIRIITFDRHFERQEQNPRLKEELRSKEILSAVLNWSLDGLFDFKKNGEQPPECVLTATTQYKAKSDKIEVFLSDCLFKSEINTSGKAVYDAYQRWCADNGFAVDGKGTLYSALRQKGMLKGTGTVNGKTERNVLAGYAVV